MYKIDKYIKVNVKILINQNTQELSSFTYFVILEIVHNNFTLLLSYCDFCDLIANFAIFENFVFNRFL